MAQVVIVMAQVVIVVAQVRHPVTLVAQVWVATPTAAYVF
jgi:hypothetical protein